MGRISTEIMSELDEIVQELLEKKRECSEMFRSKLGKGAKFWELYGVELIGTDINIVEAEILSQVDLYWRPFIYGLMTSKDKIFQEPG